MVNFARCKCLGANVLRGPKQVPWDGKLNYDYQLWIDNDIVFNTEALMRLVVMDQDIAAGWYATEDGHTTSVAHWLSEEEFKKNRGVMNHETVESMQKRKKPFTVDYTGSGEVQDMCGEDVSFCLDAKKAGFEIWCNPLIRVGHEKTRVI
jgi:hypothetical protein